ncbi:MAG: hypothetical protein AB7P69_29465 [Candidatus Binatia bacterium]
MFSEQLSHAINDLALRWIGRRVDRLEQLNPQKFYVENIRAILKTSSWIAEKICELGVAQGYFDRHVEALHPIDGNAVVEARTERDLPEQVPIWVYEDGSLEEKFVSTLDLPKLTYYSLHRDEPA